MAIRNSAALLAAFLPLTACASGGPPSLPETARSALRALAQTGAGKIKHVIYIVQENRSFDNLFQGYPGADTVSSGKDSKGKTVVLAPASLATQYDIDHSAQAMFAACHGAGRLADTKCRMDSSFRSERLRVQISFCTCSTITTSPTTNK